MQKRIYKPLDTFDIEEIKEILNRNQIEERLSLPLSVGQNHPNWKFAKISVLSLPVMNPLPLEQMPYWGLRIMREQKES